MPQEAPPLNHCFRLDLEPLILAGPEATDHTCLFDQFYVTGGSNPVPTVCGTNIGHHSKSDQKRFKSSLDDDGIRQHA